MNYSASRGVRCYAHSEETVHRVTMSGLAYLLEMSQTGQAHRVTPYGILPMCFVDLFNQDADYELLNKFRGKAGIIADISTRL